MINSNEQCRKSADSENSELTSTYSNISIDEINKLIKNDLLQFNERISSTLIIIEPDINLKLLTTILNSLKDKSVNILLTDNEKKVISTDDYKKILGNDIFEEYKNYLICYDKGNHTDYKFFGTTKAKIPILLHKSFVSSDLILPICNIKSDNRYGVISAKYLIAFGLASDKADIKLNEVESTSEFDNIATDICLIARSDVEYFAINYIEDGSDILSFINTGDILLSHIKSSEHFSGS